MMFSTDLHVENHGLFKFEFIKHITSECHEFDGFKEQHKVMSKESARSASKALHVQQASWNPIQET
jgi:hypothetical protein